MKNLFVLKGGSGAGKGTRVCQLMEYLKALGNNCQTIVYNNNGKNIPVGKYFPAFGLFIPGKYSLSNKSGLTSWAGVDYLHSVFKTAEKAREVIKELINSSDLQVNHLILEGEPMFLSDKYRPLFLKEFYSPENIYISYFQYDNREQYDNRIEGRSGKKSGDSGWTRIASYLSEFNVSCDEATKTEKCYVSSTSVDEQPFLFVNETLTRMLDVVAPKLSETKEWCEANPMLRSVDGEDPLNKSSLW